MPFKPMLLKFKIEGFEGLPSEQGESTFSEQLTDSKGNAWKLEIYPCGSVFLLNTGTEDVRVKYSIILRNKSGYVVEEKCSPISFFKASGENAYGVFQFLQRSAILDKDNGVLVDGALLLDVELQYKEESSPCSYPSSLSRKMLQLLQNEELADIEFRVGEATFMAHKAILSMNAPVLFGFCEENDDGSPVPIIDTAPGIFHTILRYVYGEEVPDTNLIFHYGTEIIDASNKFGITGLKLAVEAILAESLYFTVENVADWLIFADSKVCPLLKEHATAYFVARSHDILKSKSSNQLKESPKLLTELMMEISKKFHGAW